MKTTFVTFCIVIAFIYTGCATVDPDKIVSGMSRDQVVAMMGKPESAVTEGQIELLSYRSARASDVHVDEVTPYTIYSVYLRNGVVYSVNKVSEIPLRNVENKPSPADIQLISQSPEANENSIRILSIEPAQSTPGKPTQFVVKVAYSLKDSTEARLSLSFNTRGPQSFQGVGGRNIFAGSGVLEYTVTLTPKDWGEENRFMASTMLFSRPSMVPLPEFRSTKEIVLVK